MMLEELLQNQTHKHSHIIVGVDFNVEAEQMAAWIATRFLHLRVISCGNKCYTKTKNGRKARAIQLNIATASMAERVEQASSMGTTLATHRPVSMTLGMPVRKWKLQVYTQAFGPQWQQKMSRRGGSGEYRVTV